MLGGWGKRPYHTFGSNNKYQILTVQKLLIKSILRAILLLSLGSSVSNHLKMKNHLISDPNDDFFLTTCFVCSNKAKNGEKYIRNYGGVVCFSCRQFFRRAHQKSKSPKFQCKNGGDCNVTDVNQV